MPDVSEYEKELKKLETQYKKGLISDAEFEPKALELSEQIAKGHDYVFVGRVGSFCPMEHHVCGGELMRRQGDKYYSVTGTKGYVWMESEQVKALGLRGSIDISYYKKLVDDAVETISQYGDIEEFCA